MVYYKVDTRDYQQGMKITMARVKETCKIKFNLQKPLWLKTKIAEIYPYSLGYIRDLGNYFTHAREVNRAMFKGA